MVGEGRLRIGEEHDAEAGEDPVEARRREGVSLGVGLDEADVAQTRRAAPRDVQHGARDVGSDHLSVRCDGVGELEAGRAGTTADIEQAFARARRQCGHGRLAQGRELAVERRLQIGPGGPRGVVPVGDLSGVGRGVGDFGHQIGAHTSASQAATSAGACGPTTARTRA